VCRIGVAGGCERFLLRGSVGDRAGLVHEAPAGKAVGARVGAHIDRWWPLALLGSAAELRRATRRSTRVNPRAACRRLPRNSLIRLSNGGAAGASDFQQRPPLKS
jgi:hypothetical protein